MKRDSRTRKSGMKRKSEKRNNEKWRSGMTRTSEKRNGERRWSGKRDSPSLSPSDLVASPV